jgi:hypothetical protein
MLQKYHVCSRGTPNLIPGDPSQQKCVKCPLYPLPSSSYSIYAVTYTWVPRVRLSSTSSYHRFQVTFNLRPWRARGCERRPLRAAAAACPLQFVGMEGMTRPLRTPAAMEGTRVRAPARRRLTAASPCFVSRGLPRPPHQPLGLPPSWVPHLHQVDGAAAPVSPAGEVAPLRINDERPHARRLEAGGLASEARAAAMGFERRPAARGEEERVTTDLPWGELCRWLPRETADRASLVAS